MTNRLIDSAWMKEHTLFEMPDRDTAVLEVEEFTMGSDVLCVEVWLDSHNLVQAFWYDVDTDEYTRDATADDLMFILGASQDEVTNYILEQVNNLRKIEVN